MTMTHPLIIFGCLAVVGCALYAAFTHRVIDPAETSPPGDVAKYQAGANHGDGYGVELSAIRHEIGQTGTGIEVLRREHMKIVSRERELVEELRHLQEEVAALRGQMRQNATAAEASAMSRDDAAHAVARHEGDILPTSQDQESLDIAQKTIRETLFYKETVDTQWSADTSDLILQVLEREDFAYTGVLGVECRTNSCRLEIQHPDIEALSQFDLIFPLQVAKTLPLMTYYHRQAEDGLVHTVIFATREGYELPAMRQ